MTEHVLFFDIDGTMLSTGGAGQRDEVALRVHQQVEREVLLAVARGDAPDVVALVRVILDGLENGRLAGDFFDDRIQRTLRFLIDEFVHHQA